MASSGSLGTLRHIDNPSITVLNSSAAAGKTWVTAGDTYDTTFLRSVAAGKGLHYKGILHGTDNNLLEFAGNNLQFAGQEGHSEAEILIQFTTPSTLAFNFGFNDQVLETGGSGSLPMEISSSDVLSANSASFVGFVYDVDSTTDDLYCGWVDDSSVGQTVGATTLSPGGTIRMANMVPTASKWFYMKVGLQDRGSGYGVRATFLAVDHNGRSMERTFNTTLDRDVPLAYYLGIEARGTTTSNIYLHNCNWAQDVPNM